MGFVKYTQYKKYYIGDLLPRYKMANTVVIGKFFRRYYFVRGQTIFHFGILGDSRGPN